MLYKASMLLKMNRPFETIPGLGYELMRIERKVERFEKTQQETHDRMEQEITSLEKQIDRLQGDQSYTSYRIRGLDRCVSIFGNESHIHLFTWFAILYLWMYKAEAKSSLKLDQNAPNNKTCDDSTHSASPNDTSGRDQPSIGPSMWHV
jgi:hypothetical protein